MSVKIWVMGHLHSEAPLQVTNALDTQVDGQVRMPEDM